jgi:predicted SprT family Zn-dependent metalloprotease
MTNAPTHRTYTSLDAAYDHFNRTLFDGQLPPCLITMQRHKAAYGYFSGNRFASLENPEEITDEIALNPATFATRTPTKILSTLVHEMVHLWQHHQGKPSRSSYHNKQWAARMREVGLIPTDTGLAGGKETGQKMTHLIEEGGRFEKACAAFLEQQGPILYHDRARDEQARRQKTASKTKYSCDTCGQNAWAKPDAHLICGDCMEPMETELLEQEM